MIEFLLLLMAVAFVGMVGVIIYSGLQNLRQPVERAKAVVLRKRMREIDISVPTNPFAWIMNILGARWCGFFWSAPLSSSQVGRLSGDVSIAAAADYYITFGIGRSEIELVVPERVFMEVAEGRSGLLVHKGEWFKIFVADPEVRPEPPQAPKPPGRLLG